MNLAHRTAWAFGLLAFLASLSLDTTRAQDTPDGNVPALNDPIEVLTRGPVHEAFAQPQDAGPNMGETAPKEPPPPIPEQPPEQKPEADNAQWLPGYWSWDAARQDFTWVSGVYRVAPLNRQFVPGYWANTDDGLQKGKEVGTYYGRLFFVTTGDWAIALQFRRDSASRLERVDWVQTVNNATGQQ